jgi:hypothetical protein
MRDQEIVDLWEAYHSIYSNIDEVICKEGGMKEEVELDEDAPKRVDVRPASPRLMRNAGPARVHDPSKPSASKMVKRVDEQTDLFDYILEHLVAEGYADTEESALVIMANMSEEWRRSIVEQLDPDSPGNTHSLGDLHKMNDMLKRMSPKELKNYLDNLPRVGPDGKSLKGA